MSVRWQRWAAPMIALLALASSAVGIVNGFAYDDRYVIQLNPVMRSLHEWWRAFQSSYWPSNWGGDGYRPLTILAYRIEAVIGGLSPVVFHAVNIILYAGVSLLVFALAKRLLPEWAAWISAALFAVHPVHVEAVANSVGQAELIVGLTMLVAMVLYLRDRQVGPLRTRTLAAIGALYAIGCFSKEHAIVLPALLIAAELTVIDDSTPWRERIRCLRPAFLLLALVAVAFVAIRSMVLGDHTIGGFQPFTPFNTLHITTRDRVLTAVGIVPQWVRLLFWPAHLSSEYSPPDVEIAQGLSLVQLPGLIVLIGIIGIGVAMRRRQPVISFGVGFTCLTLLPSSNFLLPAGIMIAERTLFLPSVGAMLIVGALAAYGAKAIRSRYANNGRVFAVGVALCASGLVAGAIRSALRTRVWRDNETLFRQAIIDSPRGYRGHYMLGAWDFENKRLRDGEAELRRALNLFPYDPFLSFYMAEQYRTMGMCGPALPMYRWSFGLNAEFRRGRDAYAWCLLQEGLFGEARLSALNAMRFPVDRALMRFVVATADSVLAARAKQSDNQSPPLATRAPSKVPDSVQKAGRTAGSAQLDGRGKTL
jgi:protein O-mannosyl-transferase